MSWPSSLLSTCTGNSDIKDDADATTGREEIPVEFSVMELRQAFGSEIRLFSTEASLAEVEDALFYLSRIGAMDLEGGFFVKYNAMMIERLETNNKRQYKLEDYQKLEQFYQNKIRRSI